MSCDDWGWFFFLFWPPGPTLLVVVAVIGLVFWLGGRVRGAMRALWSQLKMLGRK